MKDQGSDKPKVRVRKAEHGMTKAGAVQVSDKDGSVFYKVPCDRCDNVASIPFRPRADREIVCKECYWVVSKGKASTRVLRNRKTGKNSYKTQCDLCGDWEKTNFMPKKEREFLCDLCVEAQRNEAPPEPVSQQEPRPEPVQEPPKPAEAKIPPKEGFKPETFRVTCRACKQSQQLKFKPLKGESFLCQPCYEKRSANEEKRRDKPDTQIFFHIECSKCGKQERVDFVPKSLSEPMCSTCYQKQRRRY